MHVIPASAWGTGPCPQRSGGTGASGLLDRAPCALSIAPCQLAEERAVLSRISIVEVRSSLAYGDGGVASVLDALLAALPRPRDGRRDSATHRRRCTLVKDAGRARQSHCRSPSRCCTRPSLPHALPAMAAHADEPTVNLICCTTLWSSAVETTVNWTKTTSRGRAHCKLK